MVEPRFTRVIHFLVRFRTRVVDLLIALNLDTGVSLPEMQRTKLTVTVCFVVLAAAFFIFKPGIAVKGTPAGSALCISDRFHGV